MGLLSFLKRDTDAPAATGKPARKAAAPSPDEVQTLRLRARRRLIGAAVLVALGVIIFPLIFETQPRPIPVDLPIEIPRKDTAPPLNVPSRDTAPAAQPVPVVERPEVLSPPPQEPASVVKPAEKAADKPAEKPAEKAQEKAADKTADKAADKTADKPKPAAASAPRAPSPDAAARAQALLDGREPPAKASAPAAGRFIVQVGAFGENKAAQEMRLKVEKLGLKTYAQAVDTAEGKRVRVRLGPFASREEADRSLAKLRAAGLPGAVLTL
jgi:DedD protein